MDASDSIFSDLVGLLKSWIPGRSEPAALSRDFWMPDQSCRVCYECDSQFSLFNRRHHCRLCGRVFCAKCTSNWIPTPSTKPKTAQEDWDKIRVCNFCFKQWQNGTTGTAENGIHVATPDFSITSPSATSFISTRSSGTCDSNNTTFASFPQSTGLRSSQSLAVMEKIAERPSVAAARSKENAVEPMERNQSPDQFEFCTNRSDGDDEEFGVYHLDSQQSHVSQVNAYYGPVEFNDISKDYESRKVHPDGEIVDSKSKSISLLQNSFKTQASKEVLEIVEKEVERYIGDEREGPSSCPPKDVDTEHMDFENNGDLWLPPEPEDEEDEREQLLFDDEDDDPTGEWGYFRHSSSFGSGEYRSRDKSNEEHNKALKNVVDGHFRVLVSQLLQVENLLSEEDNDKESWLDIITSLSWEAATLLKPDTSKGGQMDPGGYVKVKCLASGRRSESMVVKGVVCKKNVAHRRMTSKIEKPRLLILGGALEYQRVSNSLSSFDTLLQQEMDHLKMAVAKIDVHNPDILLVEKSVSRYAQEYLLAKDISLVLNIKRPLLERIERCTGGQIVPSIDNLSSPRLGYCDMFHVERFSEEHGTAGQAGKKLVKTLMYFEGCPKPLGCTILLRGANGDELKKVKHVVQYGVFAAYHLALETSFLADEGASLPQLPLNAAITVALPDKSSTIDRSISMIPGYSVTANEKTVGPQTVGGPPRSKSVPISDLVKFSSASTHEIQTPQITILPLLASSQQTEPLVSSSVQGVQNHSFNELSSFHSLAKDFVRDLQKYSGGETSEAVSLLDVKGDHHIADNLGYLEINNMQNDLDMNQSSSNSSALQLDGKQVIEEHALLKDEFPPSPSDHQSILVSLSSRCVWKGTVCERSHLFRIKYYGNFDKPLGRFLRDHLFDETYRCRSCEMPSEAHVQCYTHRQGTLTISVKKLSEIHLPGKTEGKIWMWHRCLRCPRSKGFPPATRRVVMSDAAWGLSFGKFLELSFSNHAAASRVASCGHSLHRDCLRFYGFGQMVACFRYASIDVYSVYLPPPKLDFNYGSQEWVKKELDKVAGQAELLFSEVLNAICVLAEKNSTSGLLNSGMKLSESRRQIMALEGILEKEKAEFEETVQKILSNEEKKAQPVIDIFEINQLQRQLVIQSYIWDHRLIFTASSDEKVERDVLNVTNSEPIEKSIGIDENILDTLISLKTCSHDSVSADAKPEENHDQGLSNRYNGHSAVDHQRTGVGINSSCGYVNPSTLPTGAKAFDELDLLESNVSVRRTLSDGQVPMCLSETLDKAWTGENPPGIGVMKNNNLHEPFEAHASSTAGVARKLDLEDHGNNLSMPKASQLPSTLSTKGSDIMEDTVSWLGMSFIKSLNNFLGTDLKLDRLREYNPVYMSSFQESEFRGGAKLLSLGVNDTVLPVYDDEPTSIIAFALVSPAYLDELERQKDTGEPVFSLQSSDAGDLVSSNSFDETSESYRSSGFGDENISSLSSHISLPLDQVSNTKTLHAKVSFEDDGPSGKVKYTVTCYYAKSFETLRAMCCPSEMDFIRSLSRCKKWGAQGGKSNVFFAKTLDDRFIIKQVTKTELESFIKFGPGYFKYLSESISTGSPTCLAKILGIYQVTSKHLKGGKESKMDVLVMENLLFGRNLMRLYDLKGSSRSRYNSDSSGSNKVLLDQNLIEAMPTSPIFVGNKAKRLLERAVWNDTAFLASIDVMDYSLLVGVDEEKHELVLGIIDFMRQYTWDKHLETWVKTAGILGGPKNASPTVISPKQYKKRFRKAMTTYFLMVPDQWSPPIIIPSKSQTDLCEETAQGPTPAD